MGTFQLVFKQMRQRALGTWLTLLSVLLGVALAISILLLRDAGQALFGQTEYGYDVVVGVAQGSPTQLVMNTVYHIDKSTGNVPYWVYEQLNTQTRPPRGSKEFDFHKDVKVAVPIAVGDTFKGRPIVGTLPKMFVSLSPLINQIDEVANKQGALAAQTAQHQSAPADLAQQEDAIALGVEQVRQQVIQTSRESVPLVEPSATASKWKYGYPVSLIVEDAAKELHAAADALRSKDLSGAAAHEDKGVSLLRRAERAIAGASGPLPYRLGYNLELSDGRIFHAWKFEAVIGSEVAKHTGLKVGSDFQATHGNPAPNITPDIHPEKWRVVGVLKPTHTAADRCLYIPLLTFYSIAEHAPGLEAGAKARAGESTAVEQPDKPDYTMAYGDQLLPDLPHTPDYISLDLAPDKWAVSAIMVESRGSDVGQGVLGQNLIYYIQNGGIPQVEAVNPAEVMRQFFDLFLGPSAMVLLLISLLVSIVAGVGILVSIYNSVSARTREIAILRALGATRGRILTLICAEAILIGFIGAIIGLLLGHALGGVASAYLNDSVGQGFNWITTRGEEWIYVAIVVAIALIAGLVPALKAYRTPVATNLVAA